MRKFSEATKIAAVKALASGESYAAICKRLKIKSVSQLYKWRNQLSASKAKAKASENSAAPAKGKSREALFEERLQHALILLRKVEPEVDRMKREGKLLEADNAHLHAILALRILQGDNG